MNAENHRIYVHYGATKFDPHLNFPIKNDTCWTKPKGGLWASRKNATFGWKEWCQGENFRNCREERSFEFMMKDEHKIAIISTLEQLHKLPCIERQKLPIQPYLIDFERCVQLGIDAIELCWYGREFESVGYGNFGFELYGWDCDSIVVLNPDSVVTRTRIFGRRQ